MSHTCRGCGTELVDGGIDYFCPNKECGEDRKQTISIIRQMKISDLRQKIPEMIRELEKLEGKPS